MREGELEQEEPALKMSESLHHNQGILEQIALGLEVRQALEAEELALAAVVALDHPEVDCSLLEVSDEQKTMARCIGTNCHC